MVWAMALGGMQDVGQNGPENEVNPLIDNGFMYTTDGWGTVYKIDARNPGPRQVRVDRRSRRAARGQRAAHARHRALGRPGRRQPARRPRHRDQPRQRRDRLGQEDRGQERVRRPGEVPHRAARRRRQGASSRTAPATRGTRGWVAALDVKTGNELWRFYTVPKPGDPGSETWKDDHNAWKTGGGGIWQTGSYDPATHLYIVGTGNPYPIYDPQFRPGDNLYTNSAIALNVETGKLAWYFQYTPNDSWDFDEVGVHMLYDTKIDGVTRKVVGHYARNGFYYTLDRTNGKFIKSEKYVNDLNWTKGIDQKTGKPVEYSPKLDVQLYNPEARALRGDGMKRTCPTWHGGVAHQPLAFNPVKNIAYGVGTEGCFSQNGAAVGVLVEGRRRRHQDEPAAQVQQRPVLRRGDGVRRGEPQGAREGGDRHRDPLGRDRHGRRPGVHGAAGRLDRRLQRRDARGALALQRRHAAQGLAGHLRDRARSSTWRCRPAAATCTR